MPDDANLISVKAVAALLKLTPRRVNQLVKDEGLPRQGRGQYDLVEVIHWYVDHTEQKLKENSQKSVNEHRQRKLAAEAAMAELELEEKRGNLITVDDAVEEIERLVVGARNVLRTLPQRSATKVARESNVKAVKALLKAAIEEVQVELASDKFGAGKKKAKR